MPNLKQVWDSYEPEAEEQAALETVAAPPDAFTANSALPLNLILYGPPGTGKTYRTVDRALQVLDPDFRCRQQGRSRRRSRRGSMSLSGMGASSSSPSIKASAMRTLLKVCGRRPRRTAQSTTMSPMVC